MKIRNGASKMAVFFVLFFMAAAFAIAGLVRERGDLALLQDEQSYPLLLQADRTNPALQADQATSALQGDQANALLQKDTRTYSALEKASYLSADQIVYIRPGLKITIQDVTIPADRRPVATILITDGQNQPLDRTGVLTPGSVGTSFILAYLPPSTGRVTDYVDYSTRKATNAAGFTTYQAGTDSGGTYTQIGDGIYAYRFGTVLPANYNTAATHTLGIYATRNLTEFGQSLYVANVTKDFVPNGSPVTQTHQVVLTKSCNQCHDPLSAHGATGRQNVEVCILCHSPQTIDPDTGNSVDMKVMTHKIHMGFSLPSVKAGTPYQIIGHGAADFSAVVFPQDIRNCQTCHKDSTQKNAWMLQPSIEACGSCHDDVNFATGENHRAGPFADSSQCASCHQPQGEFEFDASVAGAHTVPYKSTQLLNPKINVLSITNTAPGQSPTIQFNITDKDGNLMALSQFSGSLGRLSANIAGPTTDYTTRLSETISGVTYTNGVASYTFKGQIPSDARGSFALELEGRITTTVVRGGDPADTFAQRDAADNVVKYFPVTDKTAVPRRSIVSVANCNQCHEKLQLHGSNRNQTEACAVCHIPSLTASSQPSGTTESVSFQNMVHKIHTGEELTNDYILGNTNFKEVLYPGDRRNCAKCHVNSSFTLPLSAGVQPVVTPKGYFNPTQPISAACMGCHDSVSTAAHAFLNIANFGTIQGEACPVCHKEGANEAVGAAHAR